jgi:protein-S-isoprenylcysteine O-methyltransferase Ste14
MLEQTLSDPWFWAFLAAVGWALGFGVVGTQALGRNLGFGIVMFVLAEVPRILLPLPFVSQPRIAPTPAWLVAVGIAILAGSLIFGTPVFRIVPLTAPHHREPLRTDGLYSIVRHPLMVCDIFWPLGWSLICGSLIGIALTPVWLLVIWAMTHVEEESLILAYGDAYRDFQARVPRLFPRLPGSGHAPSGVGSTDRRHR